MSWSSDVAASKIYPRSRLSFQMARRAFMRTHFVPYNTPGIDSTL
jgi:hypothetical protein